MNSREGVIRFKLSFEQSAAVNFPQLDCLNHWRARLREHGLIGSDPGRYAGLGFGNLSARLAGRTFIITGSQTGALPELSASHFSEVIEADPQHNELRARGPLRPSSEALTHAAIYQAAPWCRYVFHCHSPEIWQAAARLGLPATPAAAEYGTAEMALAVGALAAAGSAIEAGILAMAGHEDGIVAFAASAELAGAALLEALARTRQRALHEEI